jgi:uncharacterized oligopeptide transporter (OPT) family protein
LKTGFTFGPQLFGVSQKSPYQALDKLKAFQAIFGFAILKPLSRILPESGIFAKLFGGGPFGPKENCTVQSAATAAGGLGVVFVTAVPAMYRLGLLSFLPKDDIGRIIALTTCTAFFGVVFVIPLRKYYIVKQKLTFPTPTATAFTIRALHHAQHGAATARKKSSALFVTFIAAFVFKVVNGYAPGIVSCSCPFSIILESH